MIYETLDYSLFESRFKDYNRLSNFPLGLRDLFQHLEELANDTDEGMELDVIGLCCEYTESSIKDALKDYSLDSLEELENETMVITVDDDTIIYLNY